MEDARFDRLARGIARGITRRGTVAGLLGGLALPLVGGSLAEARNRGGQAIQAEKKRRKKCQSGLMPCTFKQGKKKKRFCVDGQTDPANCGGCGIVCGSGQTCEGGGCTCNGIVCTGCCDGNSCQAGTSNQLCGTNGMVCQQCTLPRTCGGGGMPGVCGCTPTTCVAEGKDCGTIPDGCGGELNCGMCDGGESERETCGGGGVANVCGCLARGSVTTDRNLCCDNSCCRDELPAGQCRCAGGCG